MATMSNEKDNRQLKEHPFWSLQRRVRRELNDHPLMESDEFSFITCLWCMIGELLLLRCNKKDFIISPMIQEMEVLDWFATEASGLTL